MQQFVWVNHALLQTFFIDAQAKKFNYNAVRLRYKYVLFAPKKAPKF